MRNWLLQPYPFTNDWPSAFKSAAGVALFVSLFLIIFKPFGTTVPEGMEWKFGMVASMFGLVTALVVLGVNGLTRLFPHVFKEESWTVWKEILFNFAFISLIGIGNMLLAYGKMGAALSVKSFFVWQGLTYAIGVFPTLAGVFMNEMRKHQKYALEASQIHPHPHPKTTKATMLVIEGDNQFERLHVSSDDIVYIAAADNYVRVFCLQQGQVKNHMIRSTMKKMEEMLTPFPQYFRCHRTYLVNIDMVEKVSGNAQGYRLHLQNLTDTIPVSRNLNDTIREKLLDNTE